MNRKKRRFKSSSPLGHHQHEGYTTQSTSPSFSNHLVGSISLSSGRLQRAFTSQSLLRSQTSRNIGDGVYNARNRSSDRGISHTLARRNVQTTMNQKDVMRPLFGSMLSLSPSLPLPPSHLNQRKIMGNGNHKKNKDSRLNHIAQPRPPTRLCTTTTTSTTTTRTARITPTITNKHTTRSIHASVAEKQQHHHHHHDHQLSPSSLSPPPPRMNEEYMKEILSMHQRSITSPDSFWLEQALSLDWFRPPTKGINREHLPFHTWFDDGTTNLAYLCLDANIAKGRGNQLALVLEDAYHQTQHTITYNELKQRVDLTANALLKSGIGKGDHVMIYMPIIMETPIIMLACARIGAIHSVVFGGFASHELAKRITAFQPKILFAASCGLEPCKIVNYKQLVDDAYNITSHTVPQTIYVNRDENDLRGKLHHRNHGVGADNHKTHEMLFDEWLDQHTHQHNTTVDAIELPSNHPSYVIYTSGTTGMPKGVVRDVGGYATMLNHGMKHLYGIAPGERWMAASDFGWVVGHSFILYGPLIAGTTSIMLDGKPVGTPDASTYWRILAEWDVKGLFTAPTAIRAIKQQDPTLSLAEPYKARIMANRPTLFLAGERSDNDSITWLQDHLRVPIIDHYWSTEIGAPCTIIPRNIALSPSTQVSLKNDQVNPYNSRLGSTGLPAPGFEMKIVDDHGNILPPFTSGNIVINTPLPPGFMLTLYNDVDRYKRGYFDRFKAHGWYDTADSGYMDHDGFLYVMGRTDDVFNVAGHRLSTGAIEEAAASDQYVAENCVVPLPDKLKGSVPVVFLVKKKGSHHGKNNNNSDDSDGGHTDEAIKKNVTRLIREHVGAVATPKHVVIVDKLPKTRSGKVLRATIRQIFKYLEHMAELQRDVVDSKMNKSGTPATTTAEGTPAATATTASTQQQGQPGQVHDHGLEVFTRMVPFPSTIEDPDVVQAILRVCIEQKLIPGVPDGLLEPCSLNDNESGQSSADDTTVKAGDFTHTPKTATSTA